MENSEITILLVDDDPIVLQATALALEVYGYKVHSVESGIEAMNIVTHNPDKYKIILLDLMMTDITGHEVLTSLNDIINKHHIAVIIHSGIGNDFEIEKAKHLGARGFLSKPYTIKELLDTIKNMKVLNCFL